MHKKIFSFVLASSISIPVASLIVSCSNNSNITTNDTTNVLYGIDQKQIITKYVGPENLNLNELKETYFEFEIDPKLSEDKNNQTYYENLKKSFDKSKIEFIDYFLPRLNDDQNSYLIFKINDSNNGIINVPINQVKTISKENNSLIPWSLNKLMTAEEIKNATKTKILDDKNLYSNLQNKLNFLMIKPYESYLLANEQNPNKLDFVQYWENNLKSDVIQDLTNLFVKNYLFFDNNFYKNIFISNDWNIKVENNKINVSFKISSTPYDISQDCAYDINLTLWFN